MVINTEEPLYERAENPFVERDFKSHTIVNQVQHEDSSEPLEPIAIIGMSCRLPGSANNPSSFWDMLMSGRTAWTPGPGRRFAMRAFQDSSATKGNTTNTGGGHFLREDVAAFDAGFFGINPVEATAIDPQQRLVLEIAYEAFENAGVSLDSIWGSNTGVYVGQWSSDYHEIETRDVDFPPVYLVTGTGPALTSNRVSYHFNLRGPSFTVDTGCSSSMVALHQAVQSLRTGETTQCFVGGVNLLLDPQRFAYQSQLKMFSKEGRSFTFDERANGYGRGEGCTGVVLKPLSAAIRDGDPVRALIRNSVLNQDGRTPGITVPSATAQEEAIHKAYRQAGLDLEADYVEAHGTGTKIGDPIELSAIAAVLSRDRVSSSSLPIGSVKGNIGHTESAAGLAGLIKAVLMLEHGIIPPQANFKTVNPAIHLDDWNIRIPVRLERQELRRISVNSFGYGGTNAHVVIDTPKNILSSSLAQMSLRSWVDPPRQTEVPRVFIISAASERACQRACRRLIQYLIVQHRNAQNPNTLLARLACTLGKKSVHSHRVALVASNIDDLVVQLNTAAQSPVPDRTKQDQARIALIFSGQGAQYAEMGCELLKSYPLFSCSLERARKQLARLGCPWDLLAELRRPKAESRINEPAFSQPLTTAIQLSLVDVLSGFGVTPCAVMGHSSGEIAGAYAAKHISLEDAMTAAYFRGKLASELVKESYQSPGGMLAVGAEPAVVDGRIQKVGFTNGRMRIACYNSPSSVTVSGDSSAIAQLKIELDSQGIFNRNLITNGAAYHSHQMQLIEKQYASALNKLVGSTSSKSSVRMFSSVTGKKVGNDTILDGNYWVRNLVSPVLFSQAMSKMCQDEYSGLPIDTLIEVGPHSQLAGPVKQILSSLGSARSKIAYTHTLGRGKNAHKSLQECLGFLNIHNGSVKLLDINRDANDVLPLVDLPPYPFDHDRTYWHESRISKAYRQRPHLPHELLGTLSSDVNRLEPRWRKYLSLKEAPWLRSHVVQGQIVFPAAAFITMAVQAIRQHVYAANPASNIKDIVLRDVSFGKALVLSEDMAGMEINLSLRPQPRTARESSSIWNEFRVFTVNADQVWTEHSRGLIFAELESMDNSYLALTPDDLSRMDSQCRQHTKPGKFYHLSHGIGLDWFSPFDCVSSIRTGQDCSIVTVRTPDLQSAPGGMGDLLNPPALDSALFHGLVSVVCLEKGAQSTCIPTFIKRLRIANRVTAPGTELNCASMGHQNASTFDVLVRDNGNSDMVFEAEGVRLTSLPGAASVNQSTGEVCHGLDWVTYVDAWTPQHRRDLCHSTVTPASFAKESRHLEVLSLHHIQQALKQISLADIPEGHLRRAFAWMQSLVGIETPDASVISKITPTLNMGPLGEAIARLGPNLPSILTGKTDPLSLLTTDNLMPQLYSDESHLRCYAQMAAYCQELGLHTPGLRVLEIGAGTASACLPILQACNGGNNRTIQRYDFTDISPGFFEAAKRRLGDLVDGVEFHLLDIERGAQEQGFDEGSYDLIIACNVVHATKQISRTLANIQPLMKPGGRFMLMELTRNTLYYNLVFGVLKGWWAGYDEGRRLSPLLTPPEWTSKLELAGFVKPEPWFQDYAEVDGGTTSVFIATVPVPRPLNEPLPSVHLITTSMGMVENQGLELEGKVSTHSLLSPPVAANIVVMLPEVAAQLCNHSDPNDWQYFKDWVLQARAVLLVSTSSMEDVYSSMWTGFARTFRLERPDIRLVTLQLESSSAFALNELGYVLPVLLDSSTFDLSRPGREVDNEFAEKGGQLFVGRALPRPEIGDYVNRSSQQAEPDMISFLDNDRTLTAELGVPGLLETVRWKDDPEQSALGAEDVRLELRAASINFKDVLIAAGQLEGITQMRNDCSGVVVEVGANMKHRFKPGDRVCALYSRSYTNRPVVHGDCCEVVPDEMSFAEAASLPIVWTTVYYSLVNKGCLSKGDKILIHSAAGAVGQAAVMLAQHLEAEIFVTVGSDSKRELLYNRYGIPHDHIFSSRTTAFHGAIKGLTRGYGVDVVLNSLSGEIFRESCNLVAPFGRFVEIGRKDLMDDALMPMHFLLPNVTFAYVDLSMVIDQSKPLARRLLESVVALAAAGSIRPVTLTTMPISEIEQAFRQIQNGKHTGKIILNVEENQEVKAVPPMPSQAKLLPNATYAVVGGLGGLGRAFISWLADHGARHILSLSRSGGQDLQSRSFIADLHAKGVNLLAKSCDVSSPDEVARLTTKAGREGFPPIRGIIQAAMVLRDSVFEDMSCKDWHAALASKVSGTENIHNFLGNDVDFFVCLSSIVAVAGNVGQSNYAAGCSFQDSLMRHRRQLGLPGYSINLGFVLETGYVSENPEVAATVRRQNLRSITIAELMAIINYAVTSPQGSDAGDNVTSLGLVPSGEKVDLGESPWLAERRFSHLVRHKKTSRKAANESVNVLSLLSAAGQMEEAVEIVCQAILQQLGRLIATPVEMLNAEKSLDSYGVDSLVTVELRNWIGTYLQANVPLMVLRGAESIQKLAHIVAKESRCVVLDAA